MDPGQIECPQCQWPVSASAGLDTAGTLVCPRCSGRFRGILFPALFRSIERGQAGEVLVDASQAACFFHAGRRAVVACDECGRFLCALCDLPVGNRRLCPLCLERPSPPEVSAQATPRHHDAVLYDSIALALAVVPVVMIWPTLLTAPATLFVVCRYWNRVKTVVPRRSRLRLTVAAVLALAQIGGWVTLVVAIAR